VEPGFAGESLRGGWNRQFRGAGDGENNFGYRGSVRVVQCEDARGTVALELATVVGVHEGAKEERGEKDESREQRDRSSTKHSAMR
jgi:hypothetical protein